jgi:hypothetical protein
MFMLVQMFGYKSKLWIAPLNWQYIFSGWYTKS